MVMPSLLATGVATTAAAWTLQEDYPLNGGGYCRLISPPGKGPTGEFRMIVTMQMDWQGLLFVGEKMPDDVGGEVSFNVDGGPNLNTEAWRQTEFFTVPFRIHPWVDEWPIFEGMISSGDTFLLDYNDDGEPEIFFPINRLPEAYKDWTDCVNRRE
jgi:hypothetical protein